MKTVTATAIRQDLFNLLKQSIRGHSPLRISSKDGNAVLLSEEDYEDLVETLELLSSPGFAKSIADLLARIQRSGRILEQHLAAAAALTQTVPATGKEVLPFELDRALLGNHMM